MSAVSLIKRVQRQGGVVRSFRSVCGGLPAPDVAAATPLLYKFSWSPTGVLAAADNGARYRQESVTIRGLLFRHAFVGAQAIECTCVWTA